MAQKRKISVTLDNELVAALEGAQESLSSQVNDAVRAEVERRARHTLLTNWLSDIETIEGPVDEVLIAAFEDLLE